jgi:hypothetical protein
MSDMLNFSSILHAILYMFEPYELFHIIDWTYLGY